VKGKPLTGFQVVFQTISTSDYACDHVIPILSRTWQFWIIKNYIYMN